MKTTIFLVILVLGGITAWWFLVGGRPITPEDVEEFYREYQHAFLSREPEDLCTLLDDDFASSAEMTAGGRRTTQRFDKDETCESYRQLFETWEKLGEKMGGILTLDYTYTIHTIVLSEDGESATADVSFSLDVAGSIMNMRGRSTDIFVRTLGKVRMVRSDGRGSMSSGR
jgi:hypothetical protein